jgi:hypothetical protein
MPTSAESRLIRLGLHEPRLGVLGLEDLQRQLRSQVLLGLQSGDVSAVRMLLLGEADSG